MGSNEPFLPELNSVQMTHTVSGCSSRAAADMGIWMIWLRGLGFVCVFAPIAMFCFAECAVAGQVKIARGATILTVSGEISHRKRSPYDSKHDTKFTHHDAHFDWAVQFDRAMLTSLARGTVEANSPQLGAAGAFSGPLLATVFATAGAGNMKSARVIALDSFTVELRTQELKSKIRIMVLTLNGRPLAIGAQGPIWRMYPPASRTRMGKHEEQRWPWAVFHMEVR